MATTTPYKDELVRIATLLKLPDDTDPKTVAEAVAALVEEASGAASRLAGAENIRKFAEKARDQFGDGLDDLISAVEKARDDLREKGTSEDLLACRATMIRVTGDLSSALDVAEEAAREPTGAPETDPA